VRRCTRQSYQQSLIDKGVTLGEGGVYVIGQVTGRGGCEEMGVLTRRWTPGMKGRVSVGGLICFEDWRKGGGGNSTSLRDRSGYPGGSST